MVNGQIFTNQEPTMLTYIEQTPDMLASNISNAKQLTESLVDAYCSNNAHDIWIVACGSSANAAHCAKPFLMKYLGCDVQVVPPETFVLYKSKFKQDDFTIVISQSGCSTNAIAALDALNDFGAVSIGLTGNTDSDFKDHAELLIDFGVGEEKVGYVTKGVVALALFLILFAIEAAKKQGNIGAIEYEELQCELGEVPSRHEIIQRETAEFYDIHFATLTSMSVVYSCGFVQAYGIASEGALKLSETTLVPSFAYEAEEFIHGPNLQLTPNYTVFLIDDFSVGSKRISQIYQATRSVTDRAFFVSNSSTVDNDHAVRVPFDIKEPLLSPLYLLPFYQIIAYRITEDLHRWDKHPAYKHFKDFVDSKTESISRIMPL